MNNPAGARGQSLAPSSPSSSLAPPRGEGAVASPGYRLLLPVFMLALLGGCFGGGSPPPQPPPPPPPPDPSPVCVPPDIVTGCWHRPPGEDWQYIPEDEHEPLCKPDVLVTGCWHKPPGEDWQFIPAPELPPEPEPGDEECTTRLDGEPLMGGPTSHQARVYDCTPLIKNMERCRDLGFLIDGQPRVRCPAAQEGSPQRYPCEVELMGGPVPAWELTVTSGDLKRGNSSEDWAFRIKGTGKGKLRACYPNGKACSDWLAVSQ